MTDKTKKDAPNKEEDDQISDGDNGNIFSMANQGALAPSGELSDTQLDSVSGAGKPRGRPRKVPC